MSMSKTELRLMLARDTKRFSAGGGIIERLEDGDAQGVQKQYTGGSWTVANKGRKSVTLGRA